MKSRKPRKHAALMHAGRVHRGTVEDYRSSRSGLATTRRLSDLESALRRHDANFAKLDEFNQQVAQTVNKLEENVTMIRKDIAAQSAFNDGMAAAIRKLAKR